MGRKREQRIRRKARAQLREMQRRLDEALAWRPVALAAELYVDEAQVRAYQNRRQVRLARRAA